jgi:hypothetical protein
MILDLRRLEPISDGRVGHDSIPLSKCLNPQIHKYSRLQPSTPVVAGF